MLYKLDKKDSHMKNEIQKLIHSTHINIENEEIETNCFDCGCRNPELISINNGILICNTCGLNHMTFPPGASILICNDIKALSEKELLFLSLGGNKKLYEFILNQCPSLLNLPRKFLYISPIIEYYRKRLENLVDSNYCIEDKLSKIKMNYNYLNTQTNFIKNNTKPTSPISKSYIKEKNEKFNTINVMNNDENENELNGLKLIINKIKKIKNKYDDYNNYLETQRTSISNINDVNNKKNIIIYKKSNIIYNKPKLQNFFIKTRLDKKERDYRKKSSRNKNISHDLIDVGKIGHYFDNIKKTVTKNYNNKYNSIADDLDMDVRIANNRKFTPSKRLDTQFINNSSKYSSKIIIREKDKAYKDMVFKKVNPFLLKINLRKKFKNYSNSKYSMNISRDSRDNKRKNIKEIIINKNLYGNTFVNNNIKNNNNNYNYKLNEKRFIEQRRPIQVNLSLQNTVDNSQINNNYKKNNYCITDITDSFFKETPTIIIHNQNKELNTNQNIKKVNDIIDNVDTKRIRTKSEKKIKTINISFMKNKICNNVQKTKEKTDININPKKENEFNDKNLIQKHNVAQFQILPIKSTKTFKKIDVKKRQKKNIESSISTSFRIKKNNYTNVKRRKMSSYNENENKNDTNNNEKDVLSFSYTNISQSKIGGIFKNSIRNKYKREKSKKE